MGDAATHSEAGRDGKRRFIFEELDIRGEIVHLDAVLAEVRAIHDYPSGVAVLLGEFIAAAVLLASTLKFRGSLTVQARSERQIPLIMAECSSDLGVRAIARGAQEALGTTFDELLGGGQLALTITPAEGNRYQGIVPLSEHSLASSIDNYFEHSEQLFTRLFLASDGERAAGMLLQQLPGKLVADEQQRQGHWERITLLAETLREDELLELADASLLHRLYHEDTLRLFDVEAVGFHCTCSRERTLAALISVGADEVRSILDEQGSVTMDCEFCNQRYVFQETDLGGILTAAARGPVH